MVAFQHLVHVLFGEHDATGTAYFRGPHRGYHLDVDTCHPLDRIQHGGLHQTASALVIAYILDVPSVPNVEEGLPSGRHGLLRHGWWPWKEEQRDSKDPVCKVPAEQGTGIE
jgi:hypothetical protein